MTDPDPEERAWSILTVTRGGVVSVVRDLTKDECRKIYERLDPDYGDYITPRYNAEGVLVGGQSQGRVWQNGDIEIREVFGPPEWDRMEVKLWDHWPKWPEGVRP